MSVERDEVWLRENIPDPFVTDQGVEIFGMTGFLRHKCTSYHEHMTPSNIDKRQEAIGVAIEHAYSDKSRSKDESRLLLGEITMFLHRLYPDASQGND